MLVSLSASYQDFKLSCKLLSWNINGIKKKFQTTDVQTLFAGYDIVAISETHLNILSKCPENFLLIARSEPIESKSPRGGVALYKKIESEFDVVVISQRDFTDSIIFKITPIEVICVVLYIPPSNTKYFSEEYMEHLQLLLSNFKHIPTCLIGDMNSRFGQPPMFNENIAYNDNPDTIINTNGRTLIQMIKQNKSFHLLNGLRSQELICDTDFTFFKGELRSQNDISLTNCVDMISEFKILNRNPVSDHKPIAVTLSRKPTTQLELVASCALDTLKHDHYDINKKVLQTVRLTQLDVPSCIRALDAAAAEVKAFIEGGTRSNNDICTKITNIIYATCKANKKTPEHNEEVILTNQNCNSRHYVAIAEANFQRYNQMLLEGREENEYLTYLNTWLEAEKQAKLNMNEEMNTRVNERWNSCKMKDGKSLWKAIDWKGKSVKEKTEEIPANIIHTYFKAIFQSFKTKGNPTLKEGVVYECGYVEELDDDITVEEINQSMNEIGTGTGLDGIAPDILKIIPASMRSLIHQLFNKIYSSDYPTHWQDQLLFPHPKKGHKPTTPQLRGIAIGALLSRVYDKILTKRFKDWYMPNKQQAGFRELMGCLLQIFVIYLLMELANATGKDLYVAFMDYEKAFDYLNRKRLMDKLCQKKSREAVCSCYTQHVPDNSLRTQIIQHTIRRKNQYRTWCYPRERIIC